MFTGATAGPGMTRMSTFAVMINSTPITIYLAVQQALWAFLQDVKALS
jgi:hypothetical protein